MQRPTPDVLITACLYAALGDTDAADALVREHELTDPLALAASMLELANAIASGYYGGPLVAQALGTGPLTDDERATQAIADAVWAHEPQRVVELYREHLDVCGNTARRRAWNGELIGFASMSLLHVYRGTMVELRPLSLPDA